MIKNISILMVLAGVLGSLALNYKFGSSMATSYVFSLLLMLYNLAGLVFLWRLILSKKSIALVALTIIFKYLILGLILWGAAKAAWLNGLGFVLGLFVFMLSILLAYFFRRSRAF